MDSGIYNSCYPYKFKSGNTDFLGILRGQGYPKTVYNSRIIRNPCFYTTVEIASF